VIEDIRVYLPIIIPLAIIQLGLMIFALVHAIRHPYYKIGNKIIWIVVIITLSIVGPVSYFILARSEERGEDSYNDT